MHTTRPCNYIIGEAQPTHLYFCDCVKHKIKVRVKSINDFLCSLLTKCYVHVVNTWINIIIAEFYCRISGVRLCCLFYSSTLKIKFMTCQLYHYLLFIYKLANLLVLGMTVLCITTHKLWERKIVPWVVSELNEVLYL